MPNFGSHLSGPIRHAPKRSRTDRGWYSNLPIGMNDMAWVHYLYDFVSVNDYISTDWTATTVGTGTYAVDLTTANGRLQLVTTAGGTDSNNLQNKVLAWNLDTSAQTSASKLQDGKRLWFEAQFSVSNVADVDAFIGLSTTATDVFTSTDYVGFRLNTGSAVLHMQNALSSTQTDNTTSGTAGSNNSVSLVANTLVKVGFLFEGNSVTYFINGNAMRTVTANLPATGTNMAITMKIKANSANARTMNVDYIYTAKDR